MCHPLQLLLLLLQALGSSSTYASFPGTTAQTLISSMLVQVRPAQGQQQGFEGFN
jgi:hypothetical protein